jgi:hypothetical protein
MNLAAHIGEQTKRVNLRPTEGQKRAGNYQKGHIKVHGLDITIENPRGSTRSGTTDDGKKWTSRLPHHYGYVRRTEGGDGDHVDVFVGPHLKSPSVYVIDQHELLAGDWDEHKCMIGFGSKKQAVEAYVRAFSDNMGRRRVGHVESMSIERFKDWLRNGNTKAPVRRAAGGRAYADGGAPAFDQTTEVPPFDQTEPVEDAGKLDAALQGAKQGLSYGFSDELLGARAAAPKLPGTDWNVPEFIGPIPARTIAGAARTGLGYATGNQDIIKTYEDARDAERRAAKAAKAQHPYIYAGSEMGAAIPAMAALPEVGAARMLAPAASRIAKFGAGALDAAVAGGQYGAAAGAGEGEGMADRAVKAATGLVSGIVGGGLAHTAGTAIGAAAKKYGAPIVNTMRGWMNPEGEAARRLSAALKIDQDLISQGKAQGMLPAEWAAARARGEPVTLADLGSSNTQSLLRSAANTSPEARAQLENVFEQRFLGQTERVGDTVRNLLPGGQSNARKTGDQLVAEYDQARVPAYKIAYQQGDRPLMSPAMERLMGSDTFVGAMKRAISSGKDRDIEMGLGGFNPMVSVTADGRIVFNKGAQGAPTYPNLQYWDQVKRELDSAANQAKRSGETASGPAALARILRQELDQQVPGYAKARGIAEQYFGESNALEAGRALAGKKPVADDVAAIMRKMDPKERELFREGYASDLVERVIGRMKDTQNITKAMFNSPNERKLAATIFGPGGMAMLKARMSLETIMNGARDAMGNSTTARQLIEAGLAGGALTGYQSGWDPTSMMQGAGAFAAARGAPKFFAPQAVVGAKHLIGKVDAKTARRVAELLTSDDPRLLREGYQMAAKSQAIMEGLQSIAQRVVLAGQTTARQPVSEGVRALQGPMGARAEEEQQAP